MKMRLFYTLLFLILNLSAYSQFKTINGVQTTSENPKNLQLINKPANKLSGGTVGEFNYTSLQNQLTFQIANRKMEIIYTDSKSFYVEGQLKDISRFENIDKQRESYISEALGLINMGIKDCTFKIKSTSTDELGMTHTKMQQLYKNIPVYGGEFIIHSKGGIIEAMNGSLDRIGEIEVNPNISETKALEMLNLEQVKFPEGPFSVELNEKIQPKTSLVIKTDQDGKAYLCYHIQAYESLVDRIEYFIDANNGELLNKYESICKFHNHNTDGEVCNHEHNNTLINNNISLMDGPAVATAQDLFGVNRTINTYQVGNQYYMIDASRTMFNLAQSNMPNDPTGVIVTLDAFNTSPAFNSFNYDHVTSSNNSWSGKQTGVSSHFNGSKAYEYFKNTFAREAISGNGQNIISFINVSDENGGKMDNAFWNGVAMFYGNGSQAFKPLARGLDVAGHEMTHGVVQNTANLEYQGESGALNESFADVFGVMIDRDDWLVGEDVVLNSAFPSGALRSMSDPHNGASTGDFGGGWQPKKYSERYTGSQDNGGVHINSGIPNHAFYLFANNSAVGKDKAEKVYYRALTTYLVKSSKFIDCRIAVVKAAQDLYGTTVANAAKQAFDAVEIFDGQGGDYEVDVDVNPGDDLILFTSDNNSGLYVFTADGNPVFNPLSASNPISKPSVTDGGEEIVFVGSDKQIHYIFINWETGQAEEQTFDFGQTLNWRNAVISKDGLRMACLLEGLTNDLYVVDFVGGDVVSYELINPTFTEGVNTGDVLYADALEFDLSGEYVVYDAENEIMGNNGSINYWDIAFIKVWNNNENDFAAANQIDKLFGSLPEGISVGNPAFSKNSPYILAFEVIQDGLFSIYGANLETNKTSLIYENGGLSFPNYSRTDQYLLFDSPLGGAIDIGYLELNADKISTVPNSEKYLFSFEGTRWGTWFSNGERVLTNNNDYIIDENLVTIYPNPISNQLNITINDNSQSMVVLELMTLDGKTVLKKLINRTNKIENIDVSRIPSGSYYLKTQLDKKISTKKIIKM